LHKRQKKFSKPEVKDKIQGMKWRRKSYFILSTSITLQKASVVVFPEKLSPGFSKLQILTDPFYSLNGKPPNSCKIDTLCGYGKISKNTTSWL
jgi:hypothetical protein